jgi:chromosome segregation ATPase
MDSKHHRITAEEWDCQISELMKQLHQMSDKYDELKKQATELRTDNIELQRKLNQHQYNDSKIEMKKMFDELKNKLEISQAKERGYESNIRHIQHALDVKIKEYETIKHSLKETEQSKDRLHNMYLNLCDQYQIANTKLNSYETPANMALNHTVVEKTIDDLKKKLEEAEQKKKFFEIKSAELLSMVSGLETRLKELEHVRDNAQISSDRSIATSKENERIKEELKAEQNKLDECMKALQKEKEERKTSGERAIMAIREEVDKKCDAFSQLKELNEKYTREKHTFVTDRKAFTDLLKTRDVEVNKLKIELENQKTLSDTLCHAREVDEDVFRNEKKISAQKLDAIKNSLEVKELELTEFRSRVATSEQKYKSAIVREQDLTDKLKEREKECESLTATVNKANDSLTTLNQRITDFEKKLDIIVTDNKTKEETIAQLTEELRKQKEENTKLAEHLKDNEDICFVGTTPDI